MNFDFSIEQIQIFLMVFIRIGAILFSIPIFGSNDFPKTAKVGLTLAIAWMLFKHVPVPDEIQGAQLAMYQLLPAICSEIMIGIAIGIVARFIFEGIQLSGQLIGFQMGFGIVNVMDPVTGASFSIIAQFQNLLATLFFIALNMHHLFFKALALSFEKIPIFHCYLSVSVFSWIIGLSSDIFILAVKIGAPLTAILLFTTVALGLIAKGCPQINVFIVGFPLKIAAGLLGIALTLPMFYIMVQKSFGVLEQHLYRLIFIWSQGGG